MNFNINKMFDLNLGLQDQVGIEKMMENLSIPEELKKGLVDLEQEFSNNFDQENTENLDKFNTVFNTVFKPEIESEVKSDVKSDAVGYSQMEFQSAVATPTFGVDQKDQGVMGMVHGYQNESFGLAPSVGGTLNDAGWYDDVKGFDNTLDVKNYWGYGNNVQGVSTARKIINNDGQDFLISWNNIQGYFIDVNGAMQNINGFNNVVSDGLYNNINGQNNMVNKTLYSDINGYGNILLNERKALRVKRINKNPDDASFIDIHIFNEDNYDMYLDEKLEINCAVEVFTSNLISQLNTLTGQVSNINRTDNEFIITVYPNASLVWAGKKPNANGDLYFNEDVLLSNEFYFPNDDVKLRVFLDKNGEYCSSDQGTHAWGIYAGKGPIEYLETGNNAFTVVNGIKNVADSISFSKIDGFFNSCANLRFAEVSGFSNMVHQDDRTMSFFGKTSVSGMFNKVTASNYNVSGVFNKVIGSKQGSDFKSDLIDNLSNLNRGSYIMQSNITGMMNSSLGLSGGSSIKGMLNSSKTTALKNVLPLIDFIAEDYNGVERYAFVIPRNEELDLDTTFSVGFSYIELGSAFKFDFNLKLINHVEINDKEVTLLYPKHNEKYKMFVQWVYYFQLGFFDITVVDKSVSYLNNIAGMYSSIVGDSIVNNINGAFNIIQNGSISSINGNGNSTSGYNNFINGDVNLLVGTSSSISGSYNKMIIGNHERILTIKNENRLISNGMLNGVKIQKDIDISNFVENDTILIASNNKKFKTVYDASGVEELYSSKITEIDTTSDDEYNIIKFSNVPAGEYWSEIYIISPNTFGLKSLPTDSHVIIETKDLPYIFQPCSNITGHNNNFNGWSTNIIGGYNSITGYDSNILGINNSGYLSHSTIIGNQNVFDKNVIEFVSFPNHKEIKVIRNESSDELNEDDVIAIGIRSPKITKTFYFSITNIEVDGNDSTCYRISIKAHVNTESSRTNKVYSYLMEDFENYNAKFDVTITKYENGHKNNYNYTTNITVVGNQNHIKQDNSLVFGEHLNLINQNFSLGYYNIDSADNLFEIGLGSKDLRQNGLEIKKTGNISAPMSDTETVTDKDLTTLEYLLSPEFGKKLPTEDPAIEGKLWNDNGALKISLGETEE